MNDYHINTSDHVIRQYKLANKREVIKRAIKYLLEGFAVAFFAYFFIGRGKLTIKDIMMLGFIAAIVFAILDTFSPSVRIC